MQQSWTGAGNLVLHHCLSLSDSRPAGQHSGLLSEHVENNHLHRIGGGYAIALSLCGSCQHSTVSALLCGMPRIVSAAVEPCSVVTDAMLCVHAVMLRLDNWPELEPEAGLGMVRVA